MDRCCQSNGKIYNDIVAKFAQLVGSEGVPMSTGTSIKFETNLSIWIDVIAYFRTPMFVYVTFDNNDDFEVNKLKKYCNDFNIKLLIYRGKENHQDIEDIYKEARK